MSSPELLRNPQGEATPLCCVKCGAAQVKAATLAGAFVYLRCSACAEVWAVQDRRRFPRLALTATRKSDSV